MNSPIAIHASAGNTNSTRAETLVLSSPPTSNSNNLPTGQSEPSLLSSDSSNVSCKHEPSSSTTVDNIGNINNNKHEVDTSSTPVVDVVAAHYHPNSSYRAQDTMATITAAALAQSTRVESDIVQHNQQHEPQPDLSEHTSGAAAVQACDDSVSTTLPFSSASLPLSSPSENSSVEPVAKQLRHVPIKSYHGRQQQQQQLSSSTSSSTTATASSTTTTCMANEKEGESEKGQEIAAERTFSRTSRSNFEESAAITSASEIESKPSPTMAMPMPIPSSSSHLSPLHVNAHAPTVADSSSFVSSSSASPSSSSSSLSDYLIIGQEQVERDDSECDQRSEHSYTSSRDSYGERYVEDLMYDDASQDSHSESHSPIPSSPPSSSPSHRDTPRRRTSRPHRRSPRPFDKEDDEGERPDLSHTFSEGYAFEQQQRITESTTRSSVRIEDEEEEIPMSSSRPQSRSSTNKSYKRRSHKTTDDSRSNPLVASSVAAAPVAAMPVFKLPTIRGLTKSIIELVVASVVCISLISCMFAFSYISTGANHALGWYSDQQIGQRIRDGLKKREHVLQETLEKMAGEEYVK
ncbi:hypothetical protein BGZ47_000737, partial [Haplosporangium gracile]